MKDLLFFIALMPDEQIQQEVTDFKQYFAEHFGASHALKSPPHITLFPPFKWKSDREQELLQTLNAFAAEHNGFSLNLKNFNSFPPRVIFVDVEKKEALRALQQDLETYLKEKLALKNDRDQYGFNPHMTIAHKDLKKELYPEAWAHFSEQTFERTFHVNSITLLQHKNGRWEVYKSYSLG